MDDDVKQAIDQVANALQQINLSSPAESQPADFSASRNPQIFFPRADAVVVSA